MVAISSYFAQVGIKVDEKALKDVDKYLSRLEAKLSKGIGGKGLKLNVYIDEAKFDKHLRGVMQRAGKGTPLKLANVTIDPASLMKSIRETLAKAQIRAPITAVLSRASLTTLRAQVSTALQGLPINVRVGNVSQRGGSSGNGSVSAARRASLTGRGDPSMQEFLMGKPDKSSLSAGNRRYVDAILSKSFGGVGGSSMTGMAIQGGLGGLARMGAGSAMGRVAGMAGMAMGGPMGGALGMMGSGVLSMAGSAFTGIWSTLGKVVTLPFQAISGAASAVTGAFYRIALAATPLVMGFNAIDRRVRESTVQGVALNQAVKDYGSTGAQESSWLMNMANNSGAEYSALVEPYTTFISASAPAMGLSESKGIFEALTQYGTTHGANTFSMNNALKAFGQMSAKGTVQLEELKNQVGDAMGFGGMMPIFADAWQQLQGRTGSSKLTGQKALDELLKATEKRQVIASKILPLVEKIARERSAGSIETMRNSSQGQRALFMNQVKGGWQNFTAGGGESGLQYFWQMMQEFSTWWKDNGFILGRYFHATMIGLDAFRLSLMELWQFITTGKHNSLTDWARSLGIDVDVIRDSLLRLRDAVLKLLGIDSNNVGTILETIVERLIQFINRLQDIANGGTRVVEGANSIIRPSSGVMSQPQANSLTESIRKDGFNLKGTMMSEWDNRLDKSRLGGLWNIIGGTKDATSAAAGALYDFGTGSGGKPVSLPPSVPNWKPEGWGTTPSDIGATRRSDFSTQQVNHSVRLEVTGNAEVIGALMDEKSRSQFPILFSQELTKALVQAPKQ